MTDFVEMFRHNWNAGRSQVQMNEALGIDRKTIRKYLAPALAEGLAPCLEEFDEEVWRARIGRWFPELIDPTARALSWQLIAAHHQWFDGQLKAPVTVATIAQRLRDDNGVDVSESTVWRYIATTLAEDRLEGKVTMPRGAVEPGSEAQIDYGKLGMWLDPASGLRVAVWVFAMILSCSQAGMWKRLGRVAFRHSDGFVRGLPGSPSRRCSQGEDALLAQRLRVPDVSISPAQRGWGLWATAVATRGARRKRSQRV